MIKNAAKRKEKTNRFVGLCGNIRYGIRPDAESSSFEFERSGRKQSFRVNSKIRRDVHGGRVLAAAEPEQGDDDKETRTS